MEIKVKQYTATTTCDKQLTVTGYYVYDKYLDMHFIFVNESYGLKSYQIDINTLEEPLKLSRFNNGTIGFDGSFNYTDVTSARSSVKYTLNENVRSTLLSERWNEFNVLKAPDLINHNDDAVDSIRNVIMTQLEALANTQNNTIIPIDSMQQTEYKTQSDIYNTIIKQNEKDIPPK